MAEAKTKKTEKQTKSEANVVKSLAEMRNEYALAKLNLSVGREQNTAKLREMRRQIARELTKVNNKNTQNGEQN